MLTLMHARLRGARGVGMIVTVVLAASAGLAAQQSGAVSWLELKTIDARFAVRGRQPEPRDVTLVAIDESRGRGMPGYVVTPQLKADAIASLRAAGVSAIVDDTGFDPTNVTDDQFASDASQGSPRVVFGTMASTKAGVTDALGLNAELAGSGARVAAAKLPIDADGAIRRPLAGDPHLPSVASAVATALGRRTAPPGVVAHALIDFDGSSEHLATIPFSQLTSNVPIRRDVLRRRVVVIGVTTPLRRVPSTSGSGARPIPRPEVEAAAIYTALRGYPLRDAPEFETVVIVIASALLVAAVDAFFGGVMAVLAAGAALLAWAGVAQVAFGSGVVVDWTAPAVALVFAAAVVVVLRSVSRKRERRRVRRRFAANEADVVERVLTGPVGLVGPTEIIAGYRIEQRIGQGGMGVVYRATQLSTDRTVALKLMSPEKNRDPVFRERFKRESRLAGAITHPHVVSVVDSGDDDGLMFIAMEYVDGVDLGDYLRRTGPLPLGLARTLIEQLASALDAAHRRDLVHRDVKPANVLLASEGGPHAYLTDFGVAKQLTAASGLTGADALVGTIDYMAPEQIRGEPTDRRADVYSLAAVLYHCLAGDPPYRRETEVAKLWAHLDAPPPRPSSARRGLPTDLDGVVATGLAKHPGDRYPSAGELARAMAKAIRRAAGPRTDAPPAVKTGARNAPKASDGPTRLDGIVEAG
jgi:serine/threonine-protein kinase